MPKRAKQGRIHSHHNPGTEEGSFRAPPAKAIDGTQGHECAASEEGEEPQPRPS